MSLIKRLSTLPEVVRRHLAGETQEPAAPAFTVQHLEVTIPEPRIAQFGYGDPEELDDEPAEPEIRYRGVH